jgi:hypothetical protein
VEVGRNTWGSRKVVVHAAVDHVHALGAAGGAHVDETVLDEQVLALDQFHPHLLRQEGVLEVGAVVHAGREHHHRGLGRGAGGAGAQGIEQQVGVMGDRRHAVLAEQFGEQPHHHLAVFQHIAHAAGHAQVVFEHVVLALALGIRSAHDIDAADVRINAVGHVHPHHFGAELGIALDLLARHHAGLEDLLVVVDVMDEAVQRRDPLHQAFFHAAPLVRGNDARDQVKGDQALGARAVLVLGAIDGKRDADTAEDHLGLVAARAHHGVRLAGEPLRIGLVVRPHALPGPLALALSALGL